MRRRSARASIASAALTLACGSVTGCAWLSGFDGDDYAVAVGGSSQGGTHQGGGGAGGLGGAPGGGGAGGMLSGGGGSGKCSPDLAMPPTSLRVFVLRGRVHGNLGGLTGGDDRCQIAAQQCLGGGTWKAYLSTVDNPAIDRFSSASGPWVLPDGTPAFLDVNALLDGPEVPIALDERGRELPMPGLVWTGTLGGEANGGDVSQFTCSDWIDASVATEGEATNSDGTWTDTQPLRCDSQAHIYCFETNVP